MSTVNPVFLAESESCRDAVEAVADEALGPGRFARAAARVREQGPHDARLSLIALVDDAVAGSVRMTPVMAGRVAGHLLGPLAVRPAFMNLGIGRELVRRAVAAALGQGGEAVILVGDPPYYSPLGFEPVRTRLVFPGPVNPARILVAANGALDHERLRGRIAFAGVTSPLDAKPARGC